MALSNPSYSTRSISVLMLAAFSGLGLWLFAPFGVTGGAGGGESAPSQLPALIRVDGAVVVETEGDEVTSLSIPISVRGDDSIDLTGAKLRAETALAETALAAVPAGFDIEWTSGNGDLVLDPGESAVLNVQLPSNSSVHADNPLDLVFTPAAGPTLIVEDVLAR